MKPVDETAETIEAEYVDPMAPLSEEEDVQKLPDSYAWDVSANDPTHRRLRAIAGAGNAYVFITIQPDDQVALDFWGVPPENLTEVLTRVGEAVAAS